MMVFVVISLNPLYLRESNAKLSQAMCTIKRREHEYNIKQYTRQPMADTAVVMYLFVNV